MGLFSKKKAEPVEKDSASSTEVPTPEKAMSTHNVDKTDQTETVEEKRSSQLSEDSNPKPAEPETALRAMEEKTEATVDQELTREKTQEEIQAELDGNDEAIYPSGLKLAIISLALCLAIFLVALDNTIIATAIPKITDQFNSLQDVGWYASSYLLTTCALQLFFGKLYTFFPVKTVFVVSILIFEIGSAICGAAPNSLALIIGRAIAGIGSAGIFSGAFVIIAYAVPMRKRPLYTGLIGAMYGIASIAGPLLGGAFTDGPGWEWCFYINLPLGAVALAVIMIFFKGPQRRAEKKVPWAERAKQLDLGGLAVFICAIVCLLLALQWGGSKYAWNSWRVILCLVLFGVCIAIFIGIQWWVGDNATVPFRIAKQRSVAAACVWSFCLGGTFFTILYWLPIWFQAIQGSSALKSGIQTLPMVLALVLANIICGAGTTALGYYWPFYYASAVLSAIGAGLLTTFEVETSTGKWIGYQILYGLGIGFGMQQSLITVQAVLPLRDVPVGTAMAAFCQMIGGAIFVSAAQNTFNNRLISEVPKYAPEVNPFNIIMSGATKLIEVIPAQFLGGVRLAYNEALTQTFYLGVATAALMIIPALFVEWKSVKGMKPGAAAV